MRLQLLLLLLGPDVNGVEIQVTLSQKLGFPSYMQFALPFGINF